MARKEAEEKREKQLKDHEERLREINDSLRRKKKSTFNWGSRGKRDREPESVFEQIIPESFPNLGRQTGIQIQEIERSPSPKINKNHSHLDI